MVMGNSVITTVTRVFTVGMINILPGVKVKMMALSEARGGGELLVITGVVVMPKKM